MTSTPNQPPCIKVDAPRTEVLIEGQPMPRVRLDRLESSLGGAPRAHFSMGLGHEADSAEDYRISEAQSQVVCGGSVTARLLGGGLLPGASGAGQILFEGRINRIDAGLDCDGEWLCFEAEDSVTDILRQRTCGQRVRTAAGQDEVVEGFGLVFNPEGRPNAAYQPHEPEERDAYTIFAAPGDASAFAWTLDRAVTYLLAEFTQADGLAVPTPGEVSDAVGNLVLHDVNLEGRTLGESLGALLELANACLQVVVEPGESSVARQLKIWTRNLASEIWPWHQAVGSDFDPAQTTFSDFAATIHLETSPRRYIARGDRKVYESTFDLVPGWDESLESGDLDDFIPARNPDFAAVRDVFRKWVLNEDGRYTGSPLNRGDPPDFSSLFEGSAYVRRPRRLLPCLSRDGADRSHGVYAEVSLDGGQSWDRLTLAARVLTGECGLYFPEDALPDRYLAVAIRHQVRVRVTATIEADDCVRAQRNDGGGNNLPGRTQYLPVLAGYRYRKVSPTSRFYGSPLSDETDDTSRLQALVDVAWQADYFSLITGRMKIPWLALEYRAGALMPGIAGRCFSLAIDNNGYRTNPFVRRVTLTLAPTVQTELDLE
jgi:hypothetical protein